MARVTPPRQSSDEAVGTLLVVLGWFIPILGTPFAIVLSFFGGVELAVLTAIFLTVVTVWTARWADGRPRAWLCGAPAAGLVLPSIVGAVWAAIFRAHSSGDTWLAVNPNDATYRIIMICAAAVTSVTVVAFVLWQKRVGRTRRPDAMRRQGAVAGGVVAIRVIGVLGIFLAWAALWYMLSGPSRSTGVTWLALATPAFVVAGAVPSAVWVQGRTRSKIDTYFALFVTGTAIALVGVALTTAGVTSGQLTSPGSGSLLMAWTAGAGVGLIIFFVSCAAIDSAKQAMSKQRT